MAINETQKLSRLARHSQEEFFSQGSLLNQTRLNRFILIALFLHASVIILQSLIIAKPKDSLAPPPIRIKYVNIQKPDSIEKNDPLIKTPKSKKIKKSKKKLKTRADYLAHVRKIKTTKRQRKKDKMIDDANDSWVRSFYTN